MVRETNYVIITSKRHHLRHYHYQRPPKKNFTKVTINYFLRKRSFVSELEKLNSDISLP